jgi:two-component system alkaline phosphatase synthesis response regulator PhoP
MRRPQPITERHTFVAAVSVVLLAARLAWWVVFNLRQSRTRMRLERRHQPEDEEHLAEALARGSRCAGALGASGNREPVPCLSEHSPDAARVLGLEAGADDWSARPFLLGELMLQIQGILRRQDWYREAPEERSVLRCADHRIDFATCEACANRRTVTLAGKESMPMKLLVERTDPVVSREQILERIWEHRFSPSSRTIDNLMVDLRRHLEVDSRLPGHVHSVRGVGYRFTP